MKRLRERNEWKFFAVLAKADRGLALVWWIILILRGVLPAVFAIAMGLVVGSVQTGGSLGVRSCLPASSSCCSRSSRPSTRPLAPTLATAPRPGSMTGSLRRASVPAAWATSRIRNSTTDLTVARDFDLGMTGPPLSISMDFIAGGLVEMIAGLASAMVLAWYRWWAPLVLAGAWLATHWLLRESAVWRDRNTDEVRAAQRDSDYAYRLAVDPPAAKELRLFGLAGWVIERFVARRTRLHELQYEATRLREKSVLWSLLLVVRRKCRSCSGRSRMPPLDGRLDLGATVMFAQCALGTAMIAFGGLNWALDGAAAPVARGASSRSSNERCRRLEVRHRRADGMPARIDPLSRRHLCLPESMARRRCLRDSI